MWLAVQIDLEDQLMAKRVLVLLASVGLLIGFAVPAVLVTLPIARPL